MRWLHKQNMNLTITGPGHNGRCFPKDRQFANKPMQAVQGADALIIVTEWKAYRSPPRHCERSAAIHAPACSTIDRHGLRPRDDGADSSWRLPRRFAPRNDGQRGNPYA
jgi:hypothetical protein